MPGPQPIPGATPMQTPGSNPMPFSGMQNTGMHGSSPAPIASVNATMHARPQAPMQHTMPDMSHMSAPPASGSAKGSIAVAAVISLVFCAIIAGIFYFVSMNSLNSFDEQLNAAEVRIREAELSVQEINDDVQSLLSTVSKDEIQRMITDASTKLDAKIACYVTGGAVDSSNVCNCIIGTTYDALTGMCMNEAQMPAGLLEMYAKEEIRAADMAEQVAQTQPASVQDSNLAPVNPAQ